MKISESLRRAGPVASVLSERRASHVVRPVPKTDATTDVHDDFREGARLGLAVGASTWLWVALVDMIVGQPLYTFHLLGGVAAFTVIHGLLNVAYGVAIVSTVHGAERMPSLIYGVGFGLLFLEVAFAFATVVLANLGLGDLAWVRIFGGSLLGASMAIVLVSRRHHLAELLRLAEEER